MGTPPIKHAINRQKMTWKWHTEVKLLNVAVAFVHVLAVSGQSERQVCLHHPSRHRNQTTYAN